MLRISVFAGVAVALLGSSLLDTAEARTYRNTIQNLAKCHEKIDPKGLKGRAFKAEFDKCMTNPDNYT
jgi:hypothetical protein